MRRENRSTWVRHQRGRPPPSESWGRNAPDVGLPTGVYDRQVWPATDELELSLRRASRYRSLLVPVDGTPFGEHALPLALGIARRADAEVRLVHVHCPRQSPYWSDQLYNASGLGSLVRWRHQKYLNDLARRLTRVGSVRVKPIYREGSEVADSLVEAANEGADLVVMATHRRGPLARFWFGSIADTVMRRLSVPLLLVRGYNAPADLTGDPLVRNILVPLDGSERAEQVLEPAVSLGSLTGAAHTLLHVLPLVTDYSLAYPGPGLPFADRQGEAWNYLRGVTARLEGRGVKLQPRIFLDEQSADRAILHYARTHDTDVIALATRGRGGLSRLVRGSVAERVIRGASVPVLVYRPG